MVRQGISVIAVGRAITLGCLRKRLSEANNGMGQIKISNLRYFPECLPIQATIQPEKPPRPDVRAVQTPNAGPRTLEVRVGHGSRSMS